MYIGYYQQAFIISSYLILFYKISLSKTIRIN